MIIVLKLVISLFHPIQVWSIFLFAIELLKIFYLRSSWCQSISNVFQPLKLHTINRPLNSEGVYLLRSKILTDILQFWVWSQKSSIANRHSAGWAFFLHSHISFNTVSTELMKTYLYWHRVFNNFLADWAFELVDKLSKRFSTDLIERRISFWHMHQLSRVAHKSKEIDTRSFMLNILPVTHGSVSIDFVHPLKTIFPS